MTTEDCTQWPLLATRLIPEDHPAMAGHFPGHPVVPGAVLLDWVIGLLSSPSQAPMHVRAARFPAAARAGMLLHAHACVEGSRVRFAILNDSEGQLCAGTLERMPEGALQ